MHMHMISSLVNQLIWNSFLCSTGMAFCYGHDAGAVGKFVMKQNRY